VGKSVFIGIDNGVTGSVGAIVQMEGASRRQISFASVPTTMEQSYTKTKKNISRIDHFALERMLAPWVCGDADSTVMVLVERPMICPGRFVATTSALRALEAVLIVLERVCNEGPVPMDYIDSREWQKVLLPQGLKGPELKTASATVGCRLFPSMAAVIKKQKDADGLLIAEYCRRKFGMAV